MSPDVVIGILAGVLGLAVGSFLNVVVARVPEGRSVVRPASACPGCGTAISPRDNVPVLSWILLRGRCRSCREPISSQYPLVELATGIAFVLVAVVGGLSWATPLHLYLVAIGVALTVIDLQVHRLPDAIVLPSYLVVAVLLTLAAWGDGRWDDLLRALFGAIILFAAYFLMLVAYPSGMGFGDVKLAGILGAVLAFSGWGSLAVGAFSAFLLGGVVSVILLATRRVTRRSGIPFGPWMIAGAVVGVVWGELIFGAYLELLV